MAITPPSWYIQTPTAQARQTAQQPPVDPTLAIWNQMIPYLDPVSQMEVARYVARLAPSQANPFATYNTLVPQLGGTTTAPTPPVVAGKAAPTPPQAQPIQPQQFMNQQYQQQQREQLYNPERLIQAAGALANLNQFLPPGEAQQGKGAGAQNLQQAKGWLDEYLRTAATGYGVGRNTKSRAERKFAQEHLNTLSREAQETNPSARALIPLAENLVNPITMRGSRTNPFSLRGLSQPGQQLEFTKKNTGLT